MFDMMQVACDVGRGNPGALDIVREILLNVDRRQVAVDLELLRREGITGQRLYIAYSDVKNNYLHCLEDQPEGYQNPFSSMTVREMLGYLRARDPLYMDHLNRLLTRQGYSPLD